MSFPLMLMAAIFDIETELKSELWDKTGISEL
jgi:hypothetical protein